MSLGAAAAALAQPPVISVYPLPNSTSSLPQTQITFRGIPASQIGAVQVVGSSTGVHAGAIQADSDGQGGSFIPTAPFAAGETVTVTTGLNVVGGTSGSWKFAIALPFGTINPMPLPMVPAGSNGVQDFHSRPDLQPASVTVNKNSGAAPGDIFVTPQYGPVQNGPMLLDPSGNLIWFQPLPPNALATDFRVQQLGSQPVLTWWQGYTNNGSGRGVGVIYNTAYQQIATVQAGNGLQGMDLHEFLVTPQGDAWIVGVSPVHYGSLARPLMDAVVQEIDIKTGLVMFEWHALDHVPITESYFPTKSKGYVYDPYHLNSVALDQDGNLIVSMRNTWGVYKINVQTGAIIWTLGTNQSTFKRGAGASTAFQHNAIVQSDGSITMFDDGGGPPRVRAGRAIQLSLNTAKDTATLVRQFQHTPALNTDFEGNAQTLPNGDLFVGWGQQPYFSEFNSAGKMVFDARFTSNTSSYRAYRMAWSGQPTTPPSIAVAPNNDGTTEVWASWNGATAVSSWRVLAGPSPNSAVPLLTAPKGGFEAAIAAPTGMPYFAVQALDSGGHVLAGSGGGLRAGAHRGRRPQRVRLVVRRRRAACRVLQLEDLPHRGVDDRGADRDRAHGLRADSGPGRRDPVLHADRAGRSMLAHARRPPAARAHDRVGRLQAELQPVHHPGPVLDQRGGAGAHSVAVREPPDPWPDRFRVRGGRGRRHPRRVRVQLTVPHEHLAVRRQDRDRLDRVRAARGAQRRVSDLHPELGGPLSARARAGQPARRGADSVRRQRHRARPGRARAVPVGPRPVLCRECPD